MRAFLFPRTFQTGTGKMKLLHILSMLLILTLSSPLLPQQEIDRDSYHINLAKEFVETLVTGDFIRSVARFDSTMKRLMPAEKTEEIWNGLLSKLGTFHEQIAVRQEKYKQYKIVYVTCQFKHSQFDVKVVFNPQNQIAGLFFVPTRETHQWETPDYADNSLFREIDVIIGEKEWELPGNITIPDGEGPFPALVLVHDPMTGMKPSVQINHFVIWPGDLHQEGLRYCAMTNGQKYMASKWSPPSTD